MMTPTSMGALAIFVKTPGYSKVKTRLAEGVGQKNAEAFHLASAISVSAVVQLASEAIGVKPYFAVAELSGINSAEWNSLPNFYQGEGGLGQRMHKVYSELQKAHGFAILLGADTPQLEISDLLTAIEWLTNPHESRFSFGPAGDGGFWIFGGNCPIPENRWNEVEYSKPNTGSVFLSKITPLGSVKQLRSLNDVDTEDDLPMILVALNQIEAPLKEQLDLLALVQGICIRRKDNT